MHSENYDPAPYKKYPYAYVPIGLRRCREKEMLTRLRAVGATLHFSNTSMPTCKALEMLNDALKLSKGSESSKIMKTLIFEGERFTASSLRTIVEGVCSSAIQTLKLRGTTIGDVGMVYLNEILEGCPTLEHLDITQSRVTATGVEIMRPGLVKSSLKELVIKSNRLGPEGAHTIMRAIPSCLTLLDMRSCGIGGKGAVHVGTYLKGRDMSLEILRLAYNRIGPRYNLSDPETGSFLALIEGLVAHQRVRWLDMEGNALYEECIEFAKLSHGTDLQRLYIGGTMPVNGVLSDVVRAFTSKDCEVLELSLKDCQLGYNKAVSHDDPEISASDHMSVGDVCQEDSDDEDSSIIELLTYHSRFSSIVNMLVKSNIVSCDLSCNVLQPTDLALLRLSVTIYGFKNLRYLNLSSNFNLAGTGDILLDIIRNTKLVSLRLDSCDLGDGDVIHIANAVRTSNIRCLGLSDNPFGAMGMEALTDCASTAEGRLEIVDVDEVFGYTITNPFAFFKSVRELKAQLRV